MNGRTVGIAIALSLLLINVATAETAAPKTLAECVAIAVDNHPSLKAADASVSAGHQRVLEAVSPYLPQVVGSYSTVRHQTNPALTSVSSPPPTPGASGPSAIRGTFSSSNASLTQILFDFGQQLQLIRAAQASEQSLQADRTTQLDAVVFNVKQAYFNILATLRLQNVADETVHQNHKHLEQADGRYTVGLAAKFDVTQAQVQLAQAELNQVIARNNVAIARETLRNALGITGPLDFDIVDNFDVHQVVITESDALAAAYDRRPELQSLRAKERATAAQITSLKVSYLPTLQATASYGSLGVDAPDSPVWSIGGGLTIPILNGGITTFQIGEQNANLANLKFTEEVERQSIALEVRQAVLTLQQAAESIRVSEKGLQLARENLDLAEGRYSTGVGNIIELTDAQASLTTAEASNVQALYTYKTALAAVEKATAQPPTAD